MSDFSTFFKKNKIARPHTKYAATRSLTDAAGKPLEWELAPLSTRDSEAIREECTARVPVAGKPGLFTSVLDTNKYGAKILAASVVFPDLRDAELQNSYGVVSPEELIQEMVDNSGEYTAFTLFVQKFNGLDAVLSDEVDAAKN